LKARRLPLLVDAFQWFPPGDERHDAVNTPVVPYIAMPLMPGTIYNVVCDRYVMRVFKQVNQDLHPTDWIIKRTHDDGTTCVYVISDEAFKRGYRIQDDPLPFAIILTGPGVEASCGFEDIHSINDAYITMCHGVNDAAEKILAASTESTSA